MPRNASSVQNWLLASSQRVGAERALLLAREGKRVEVLACLPAAARPDRSMSQVAGRALKEGRALVRAAKRLGQEQTASQESVYVGFSMRIGGRPAAVVFMLSGCTGEDDATILKRVGAQILRRAEDRMDARAASKAVLTAVSQASKLPGPREAPQVVDQTHSAGADDSVSEVIVEQGVLLAAVATLVEQTDLEQSLHALACRTAQEFCCLRVHIGCKAGRRIVIRAVSGLVDFDPRSALMIDVAQAMNETMMLASTIRLPDTSENRVPPHSHASLAEQLNNPALISVPLAVDGSVIGVLMLERDRAFDDREAAQLERLSLLISPLLSLKTTETMSAWQLLGRFLGRGLKAVFGSRRVGLKLLSLALVILTFLGANYNQMFRVDADASVEARTQRAVVSSFPSFLSQVEARAGDVVQRGDVLAQLDIEELQLDKIKLEGEREKLIKEYRATLAQRDRSKVRILEAQRSQSQAQIDLIDAQIERATLRAPIDGVVISGDLLQSLGRPVERGELLFEVASLDNYRLILKLDEKDIGWVKNGSKGLLRLRSLTQQTFPFEVTRITPVSEPGEGVNTFRVEATLEDLPESLRPGMEGVAKIEIESRAIGWIWTRSFVEWIRMQIWTIGGL